MRVFLVLMLLPLAGCLSDGNPQSTQSTESTPEAWAFQDPVMLACPDLPIDHPMGKCDRFMEPVMEVTGDGEIWYSATCCAGRSPPIWRSMDGVNFELIPMADGTGVIRDATGIEGDFAVDDAGQVYFFDILLATAYITKFNEDGSHAHTKPDVFEPLVDRPWIRAGVEDEVMIFYNTGGSTNFLRSEDGGLTWDYLNMVSFPCPLMTFGQGERDHFFVTGCSSNPRAWESTDGGRTWSAPMQLPAPEPGAQNTEWYMPVAIDAAGTAYVTSVWQHGDYRDIFVHTIQNGTPSEAVQVSENGWHEKPWPAAGNASKVGIAWYGAVNATPANPAGVEWHLQTAFLNATGNWTTTIADPEPVLTGSFGRNLGDFLQSRMGPDGNFHVAYAKNTDGPESWYLQSKAPNFGKGVPYNG